MYDLKLLLSKTLYNKNIPKTYIIARLPGYFLWYNNKYDLENTFGFVSFNGPFD